MANMGDRWNHPSARGLSRRRFNQFSIPEFLSPGEFRQTQKFLFREQGGHAHAHILRRRRGKDSDHGLFARPRTIP